MIRNTLALLPALTLLCNSLTAGESPRAINADEARAAIQRGVEFLLRIQNSDGSWGGPGQAVYTFTGAVWTNPETHRSWRVGTSGLCCNALLEAERTERIEQAADKAVDYLIKNAAVKRPSEWDTMNNWAYIYGVQALARAYADPRYANTPRREQCRDTGEVLLYRLARCQALNGGWGYLEFDVPRTRNQQWATSFMTAAAVVALEDARAAGFDVDEEVIRRAARGIERCRLPSGAYTYSIPAIADPRSMEWIDQIKGSLCRIQSCNLALLMEGKEIPLTRLQTGLSQLFEHHRFLDIARNKPIPHETFYYNSGYFYLFGHYYAARLVNQLPAELREQYWPRLRYEVVKLQQEDGAMYDYDMHAYGKPYGTAYGVLTLMESVKEPMNNMPEKTDSTN